MSVINQRKGMIKFGNCKRKEVLRKEKVIREKNRWYVERVNIENRTKRLCERNNEKRNE